MDVGWIPSQSASPDAGPTPPRRRGGRVVRRAGALPTPTGSAGDSHARSRGKERGRESLFEERCRQPDRVNEEVAASKSKAADAGAAKR